MPIPGRCWAGFQIATISFDYARRIGGQTGHETIRSELTFSRTPETSVGCRLIGMSVRYTDVPHDNPLCLGRYAVILAL